MPRRSGFKLAKACMRALAQVVVLSCIGVQVGRVTMDCHQPSGQLQFAATSHSCGMLIALIGLMAEGMLPTVQTLCSCGMHLP